MRHLVVVPIVTMALSAQAAPAAPDGGFKFELRDSATAKGAHGVHPSKIVPTKTEAAMKFFVINLDKGPVEGAVIASAPFTAAAKPC